jgi:hypothetical protein
VRLADIFGLIVGKNLRAAVKPDPRLQDGAGQVGKLLSEPRQRPRVYKLIGAVGGATWRYKLVATSPTKFQALIVLRVRMRLEGKRVDGVPGAASGKCMVRGY